VDVIPADFEAHTHGQSATGVDTSPASDDDRGAVGFVPAEDGEVDLEEPPDLGGDRAEDLLRRCGAGDQRRHAAQGGLLLPETAELQAGVRMGDEGRHQFGKAGQPRLGVGRQRHLGCGGGGE
jgi:hypothetical protein